MGHIYDCMGDEINDFARDKGVKFKDIEFPWKDSLDWDPEPIARKNLVALLKDENQNPVGKVHFKIIVNPHYGEPYEHLWIIDGKSLKIEKTRNHKEKMKVPYTVSETRYWSCPKCEAENKTYMEKDYLLPVCEECGEEFEWGENIIC